MFCPARVFGFQLIDAPFASTSATYGTFSEAGLSLRRASESDRIYSQNQLHTIPKKEHLLR